MAHESVLFNDLLAEAAIAPRDVRLLRHHTSPGLDGCSLHDLWSRDRGAFELYQRTQKADELLLRTGKMWATFTSPAPGVTLFAGLYDARLVETRVAEWACPYRGNRPGDGNPVDLYETALRPELAEHIGTLTIDWDPASIRTWKRYAEGARFRATIDGFPGRSLVQTLTELKANLATFEELRRDRTRSDHATYLGFVQRGHCLLPYTNANGLAFAPSRLIGYRNDTLSRHAANPHKDGKETDQAISAIIGVTQAENHDLDRLYRDFCASHGLKVHAHDRKYWPIVELEPSSMRVTLETRPHRFERGQLYSRREIAEAIGHTANHGGNWDTGYARVGAEYYVFANVGSKGRTGHDYANRWEGRHLVWSAKNRTKLGQPEITALLSGDHVVHLFWRAAERERFTYAGPVVPFEISDSTPVRVRWSNELQPDLRANDDPSSPSWRRGPPPISGPRTLTYDDGPTFVYLLELTGPIAALFPTVTAGHRIIKIGMSKDPVRRVDDLSCGLPPGCAMRWQIAATREFETGPQAFERETLLLERLRLSRLLMGGEYAAVPDETFLRLRTLE